ncbi:hypothetical protein [Rhizobium sp.]
MGLNLASRLIGDVAYAADRTRSTPAYLPERWIAATVTRPRWLLDLVQAGAGDAEPDTERAGDEIPELRHRPWVVTNNDDCVRHEIRTLADRLTKLLKAHQDLYAGKRPVKNS